MTDPLDSWLESVMLKVRRHTVVFLQVGAAHEPARRALTAANVTRLTTDKYMDAEEVEATGVTVIDNLEALVPGTSAITMGALRKKVLADADRQQPIILLSRAPRIAYPAVVGSDLLDDARFVHAPFDGISRPDELPSCAIDEQDSDSVVRLALRELGPEVCASLDRIIFEHLLVGAEALRQFDSRELEAIIGAGLASANSGALKWHFPKHLAHLKHALENVLADALDPQPQFASLSAGLWKIERTIRREIRSRAIAAWGDAWRTTCLQGDLATGVLERATESVYVGAASLKQIRDPLEWLTLGELLSLCARREIGNLGLTTAQWRKFKGEIMPIRNRLAHMRNLRPKDAEDVVTWVRVLELKFPRPSRRVDS